MIERVKSNNDWAIKLDDYKHGHNLEIDRDKDKGLLNSSIKYSIKSNISNSIYSGGINKDDKISKYNIKIR